VLEPDSIISRLCRLLAPHLTGNPHESAIFGSFGMDNLIGVG